MKIQDNDISLEDNRPPPVKLVSRALSDGSRSETPRHNYKHTWTVKQRVTLTMLAVTYSNNWNELTAVFNNCHKSDLRNCGGLRKAVVNTQWNDMRRKHQALQSSYDRKLASLSYLEKKANEVGVTLISKKKSADPIDDSRTDFLPDHESQTTPDFQTLSGLTLLPTTPKKAKNDNSLPTPPDSRERKLPQCTATKRLAQIGWRACTTQSQGRYSSAVGIRAGACLHYPTVPLAQDLGATRYREEAL